MQVIKSEAWKTVLLYAGHVFHEKPHRDPKNKWYVSVEEYPHDKYPPFVQASYILSNKALRKFYYATMFVKSFRMDDVYLGILAHKLQIDPLHNPHFWDWRQSYKIEDYQYAVSSHGFSDPQELERIWNRHKRAGYA